MRVPALVNGAEADLVAGAELADLPELGVDDGGRTDEAAETGAIGTEDDGHVAGEIDRADGVGVVVNVGGVQAGFAAVFARPFGLGSDQADAGAVGVVVDLPRWWRRRCRCRCAVKKSGAPCGP